MSELILDEQHQADLLDGEPLGDVDKLKHLRDHKLYQSSPFRTLSSTILPLIFPCLQRAGFAGHPPHSKREAQRLRTSGGTAPSPPSHKYTGSAGLVTLQDDELIKDLLGAGEPKVILRRGQP